MTHSHSFNDINPLAEQRTRWVLWLTVVMMVVELIAGWYYNSMALLADGWHMSSHSIALGLSAAAYVLSRKLAADSRFAFGTWKIEVLGGYTSAIVLIGVAIYMVVESITRLLHPSIIAFDQAIAVASLGLFVNLVSAWMLSGAHHNHGHNHDHHHDHTHDTHNHHQDLNLRSAYIHVAADAATSVLAIIALATGKYFGTVWLDPVMGLVGAALVASWCISLLRDTAKVLLDAEMDAPVVAEIREVIDGAKIPANIQDLHVWRVGKGKYACVISIASSAETTPDEVRKLLSVHEELVHVTVEINQPTSSK
jgi:cation diffusion facilitator family transporter